MSTGKHYIIELNSEGFFAVRAQDSQRSSAIFSTQAEAMAEAQRLNPEDYPDVERVRNAPIGNRDQWRTA